MSRLEISFNTATTILAPVVDIQHEKSKQDKVLGTFFKEFVSGYKVVFKDIGAGI